MNLTNIEELEDLHLKTKTGVDEEKNKVGHLSHVDHAVDVVGALDEGQSPLFPRNHRNWTLDGGQVLPCEVLDQPLKQSGLSEDQQLRPLLVEVPQEFCPQWVDEPVFH